jgi:cytochrome c oxidase subunit 2
MPIAVQAVPPAQFAAWVAAKGGTMPPAGQASNKVIPQTESDIADDTSNGTEGGGAPVENATIRVQPKVERATGNEPGLGNPGI